MPPLVLPTHLFGGICRGHVTSRTHHHSRLPPLRVRAAQALPVKGFPKGKPLWSIFGHFLLIKKVATQASDVCLTNSQTDTLPIAQGKTSPDFRCDRSNTRKRPRAADSLVTFF